MMEAFQRELLTSGAEQHAVTLGWNGNTGNDFFATFTRPFARL
jgi:hypothetical protein